jgi:hypothetical protein
VDWGTPIGTALGAVVGVGSTLLSERARWSLGRADRRRDALKSSYAAYLANLAKAVEQVWHAARDHREGWLDAAMTSMRDHEVQEARFDLSLVAPQNVVRQAEVVSIRFSEWRDIVGQGARQGEEPFEAAWHDYYAQRAELLELMRDSLEPLD